MEKHMGPYRATKLWNDVIRMFRHGMPVSRHRRYMKSYDDSFTPTEAIDWLHAQLQINPNFGPSVTRAQTLQLLEKLQKACVFEDVRGVKINETITENGRLYRFTKMSPSKSRTPARSVRTPLVMRATENTTLPNVPPTKLDFGKSIRPVPSPNCQPMRSTRLSREEVESVWKTKTLASLQTSLQLRSLDDILDIDLVNAQYVAHNMTHFNKNGVVCNIDKEDQLPYWVLSAMRCLAHWPNKVEENFPDYPGFERDVFKVVKDYFEGLEEPLLTFSMYEVITNVFVCAENVARLQGQKASVQQSHHPTIPGGITSFASVENLMMDLTMNGTQTEEDEAQYVVLADPSDLNIAFHPAMGQGSQVSGARSCDPRVKGTHPQLRRCQTSRDLQREARHPQSQGPQHMRRNNSAANMAIKKGRLESSFGVANRESEAHERAQERDAEPGYYNFYDVHSSRAQSVADGLSNRTRYMSSTNLETTCGVGDNTLQQEQKWMSTGDVSRVLPYPENGLSKYHNRSSYNSVSDIAREEDTVYGYTVVVSTTPTPVQPRARTHSASQPLHHHVHTDHDYYRQSEVCRQPMRAWKAPPPYVPPPSYYQSSHYAPSEHSSHSSYETALTHLGSTDGAVEYGESNFNRTAEFKTPAVPGSNYKLQSLGIPTSVYSPLCKRRLIEALRVCCLLLPPANRRKLHLLLRLMVKMSESEELQMEGDSSTKDLVHRTFTRCILRSMEEADYDEILSLRITDFMMDNYADIMKVPADLKRQIEDHIAYLRKCKLQQVSVEEFEKQKLTTSQQALDQLLIDIIKDKAMTEKDKKRRLKQFQKNHPDIYARHFPQQQDSNTKKPRIKPALLGRPLMKLKSFRI